MKLGREVFHTDVKFADHLVVLRLLQADTPYLLESIGATQWASGNTGWQLWLPFWILEEKSRWSHVSVALLAGPDNRSNEAFLLKASAACWPLQLVNMQLSAKLMKLQVKLLLLRLLLRWRPRDENTLADALTNDPQC